MGVVYRATHLALDHVVALKVISPALAEDERFRRRFGEESRIAVSIRHPNVVPIHHAGEEDGLLFVTMDLIDGTDLRGLLRAEGPLDPEHAAAIVAEVAAALDAAHERGLVHRDVKPGNILIEPAEAGERVFLTDFGLARQVEASTGVTATGAFVGTLDYVAPEQIRGERVDARTDVYALGCVLFELLTGNPPFAARDDKVAKIYAQLEERPPSLRVLDPELPGELDLAVSRALAKDPNDRFPSAGDFARAVSAAVAGQATVEAERSVAVGAAAPQAADETTVAAQRPAPAPALPEAAAVRDPGTFRRRGPMILGALAALAAVAVAAILVLGGGDDDGDGDPDAAGAPQAQVETPRDEAGGGKAPRAKIAGSVQVGGLPVEVAHGEGGIWVTSRTGNRLTYVDVEADSERIDGRYAIGNAPEGVAVSAGFVWVAVGDDGAVVKLNAANPTDPRELGGFTRPQGIVFGAGDIWVSDYGSDELVRIDAARTIEEQRIPVGDGPYGIAVDERAVWVSNRLEGSVSRVPLAGGDPQTLSIGADPKGVAAAGGSIWVALTGDNQVARLDREGKVTERIDVSSEPRGVTAGFGSVWVASGGGAVTRIDEDSGDVIDRIDVGAGLEGITVGPESIWVANGADGEVTRIDPQP
jgi:serine/threonine-protein kinase